MEKEDIKGVIIKCVESLNLSLVDEEKISTSENDTLFGDGSALDSMGLLSLLMDMEENFEELEIYLTILDDHALSQKNSPFRTILSLTDYIYEKIQNAD